VPSRSQTPCPELGISVTSFASKRNAVLILVLGAVLVFAGWSQNWATLQIVAADVRVTTLSVTGQESTVLPAGLALVTLATGLVLLTAGRILASAIGLVNLLVSAGLISTCALFAVSPPGFLLKQLSALSGISDVDTLIELVGAQSLGGGLFVAFLGAVVVAFGSVLVLVGSRSWKPRRSRFDRATSSSLSTGSETVVTIDAWDEMTRGADPTS
jgi:uncharacterized membrane protein (TIGR02234 family)